MPHAGDLDRILSSVVEEHPVIAATEAEAGPWWFELFHVAGPIGQVPINAVKNLHGSLPLDRAQIGAGFR
jgi:hypothetical protein